MGAHAAAFNFSPIELQLERRRSDVPVPYSLPAREIAGNRGDFLV
jgi:hypothetical protein